MKLKIEVNSWNNYPSPTHTHLGRGGGLLAKSLAGHVLKPKYSLNLFYKLIADWPTDR